MDLISLSREEQLKSMNKLHKQMGHQTRDKFLNLLKDANAWYPEAEEDFNKIIDDCEGCLLLKRNPVVSMPMASNFQGGYGFEELDFRRSHSSYSGHVESIYSFLLD